MTATTLPTTRSSSAVLPIAQVALRILVLLNWVAGTAILTLLLVSPHEQWIMSAFKLAPSPEAERLVMGLRVIAVLGLVAIPLNYAVLKRLLAIVETIRGGSAFEEANAARLQSVAWTLLTLQLLGLVIGLLAKGLSTKAHPVHIDGEFSLNGLLVVLLTFVLAQVFAQGARMRAEIEAARERI